MLKEVGSYVVQIKGDVNTGYGWLKKGGTQKSGGTEEVGESSNSKEKFIQSHLQTYYLENYKI